jgi:hypothetical protein
MFATTAILSTAQAKRVETLPHRAATAPARTSVLEGLRQRNAVLDALFYDVSAITHAEAETLSAWLAAEGMILIVPPSGAGMARLCPTIDDFFDNGGAEIASLAVAGVGSSALGSAAFARNVADATGKPVAAVVSGYGLSDALTEALGGFFWFGGLNSIRRFFEPVDEATEPGPATGALDPAGDWLERESRDTRTVLSLLADERFRFDLLVGHSKGNLVLAEALYGFTAHHAQRAKAFAKTVRIVTISARIYMPRPFHDIVDVMGEWDWFGEINSRRDLETDLPVKGAWHHTNTELAAHVPVTEVLRGILAGGVTRPAPPSPTS